MLGAFEGPGRLSKKFVCMRAFYICGCEFSVVWTCVNISQVNVFHMCLCKDSLNYFLNGPSYQPLAPHWGGTTSRAQSNTGLMIDGLKQCLCENVTG